jgi:uncharacterized YigZ family protein
MSDAYYVANSEVIDETIVNRSRFICYLKPCCSVEQSKIFIKQIHELHPQARHHCYAFVAGAPNDGQSYGFSDDGEPSGTAGRPMFAVLQGSGLGHICAVVVRYFGGIKLGMGGLQRAYGGSVRQALDLLQTDLKIAMVYKALVCQYNQVNDIQHLIITHGGKLVAQDYSHIVHLTMEIPLDRLTLVQQQLLTLSAGQLSFLP